MKLQSLYFLDFRDSVRNLHLHHQDAREIGGGEIPEPQFGVVGVCRSSGLELYCLEQ